MRSTSNWYQQAELHHEKTCIYLGNGGLHPRKLFLSCEQHRYRPACAAAQSAHRIFHSHSRKCNSTTCNISIFYLVYVAKQNALAFSFTKSNPREQIISRTRPSQKIHCQIQIFKFLGSLNGLIGFLTDRKPRLSVFS